jgi:hypothetical protein
MKMQLPDRRAGSSGRRLGADAKGLNFTENELTNEPKIFSISLANETFVL